MKRNRSRKKVYFESLLPTSSTVIVFERKHTHLPAMNTTIAIPAPSFDNIIKVCVDVSKVKM